MKLVLALVAVGLWPLLLAARAVAAADVVRWGALASGWGERISPAGVGDRAYLAFLCTRAEFRSVLYYRLRMSGGLGWVLSRLLRVVYPPQATLLIDCPSIGPGLYIQHGLATVISADRIGSNCWVNQQVTVGYGAHGDRPTIGDDVKIRAGAIVVGGVHLGDGCQVNAGAVVVKDVEPGVNVAGVPARVVSRTSRGPG